MTTTAPSTLAELGAQWAAAQMGSAVYLWRFAQGLAGFVAENEGMTLAQIGQELATAAQRSAPYSKSWVSRALKAARETPTEPVDEAASSRFVDLFYGNDGRQERQNAKKNPSAEELLKSACTFAGKAVALGVPADEAEEAIRQAIEAAGT